MYNSYSFTFPIINYIALYIVKVRICFKLNTKCVRENTRLKSSVHLRKLCWKYKYWMLILILFTILNLTPFRSNFGGQFTKVKNYHHYGLVSSTKQFHAVIWKTTLKSGVLSNALKTIVGFISSETLHLSTRSKHSWAYSVTESWNKSLHSLSEMCVISQGILWKAQSTKQHYMPKW